MSDPNNVFNRLKPKNKKEETTFCVIGFNRIRICYYIRQRSVSRACLDGQPSKLDVYIMVKYHGTSRKF